MTQPSVYGQLNPHFNFFNNPHEKEFYQDMVDEVFGIYGVECLYIPRDVVSIDSILGESYRSLMQRFVPIALLMEDTDYTSNIDLMTQFGLKTDTMCNLFVSRRIFRNKSIVDREKRPMEGDIIVFANTVSTIDMPVITNDIFQINHILNDKPFWRLGHYYTWLLECQVYTLSPNERFTTGLPQIDRITDDIINQFERSNNKGLEIEKEKIIDFTETNPFGNF